MVFSVMLAKPRVDPIQASIQRMLVAYWGLEEASGTRKDLTGRGNDLSATNNPSNAAGIIGKGVACAGRSPFLGRASTADLAMPHVDFSFWCWVKLNSKAAGGSRDAFMCKGTSTSSAAGLEWLLEYDGTSDRFKVGVSNGATLSTAIANNFGSPPLNTLTFLMGLYDSVANLLAISVNQGTPNSATPTATVPQSAGLAFGIGATGNGGSICDATIDEAGVCKGKLTAAQQTWLYNGGAGRRPIG